MRLSLRLQILAVILLILGFAVGAYLYIATDLFERDRVAYVYDLAATATLAKSEEVHAHLQARIDRMTFTGRALLDRPEASRETLKTLMSTDTTLLAFEIWERRAGSYGRTQRAVGVLAAEELRLGEADLEMLGSDRPLPLAAAAADGAVLLNSSLPPDVPILTLVVPVPRTDAVAVADFYPRQLLRLVASSKLYDVAVLDSTGSVLVHTDQTKTIGRANLRDQPIVQAALRAEAGRVAKEFDGPNGPVLGAFARIHVGRLIVIAEVPKREALFAIRQLNTKTWLFAVVVFFFAFLVSIFFSRRVTAPLADLESATERVSAGDFDISMPVRGVNEVGRLASAFNKMSKELAARDDGLKQAYSQMQQQDRMAMLGTLAAGVAHEINNPLSYIVGNYEYAAEIIAGLKTGPDDAENVQALQEALADVGEGAERVRRVARDLKVFAHPEDEISHPVDLARIVDSSLKMAWHEVKYRARIDLSLGEVPPVMGNDSRLGQVFLNLIVNAAHSIPAGHVRDNTIRVVTRTGESGQAIVEISDTGTGIPDEVLPNIFTPFFTTKGAGEGTGLGLPISLRIIQEHGGRIDVDTSERGTTFRVSLPGAAGSHPPPDMDDEQLVDASHARILVIDDEPAIGIGFRRWLGKRHSITLATSGTEGLALLAESTFDVIFCDLIMPEMTGMEVFDVIQRTRPELAERFVFMTGETADARVRKFLGRVSNNKLEKPFDIKKLRRAIGGVVGASTE